VGTLELGLEGALTGVAGYVEAIAVRVADEHVAGIRNINAIGKASDLLVANAIKECAVVLEDGHTMALEIAHVKVVVWWARTFSGFIIIVFTFSGGNSPRIAMSEGSRM